MYFANYVASTLESPVFDAKRRMEAQKEIMEVLFRKASEAGYGTASAQDGQQNDSQGANDESG